MAQIYQEFYICGQTITAQNQIDIVADSKNYISFSFRFSSEWDEIELKTAVIINGGQTYNALIDDNGVISDNDMPVLSPGECFVSVFGGDLYTADTAKIYIRQSGYECGGHPAAPPTDIYTQIINRLNLLDAEAVPTETIASAVTSYFEENPVTAEDIGALSESGLSAAITAALAQAAESGAFNGQNGADGQDGVNGVDGQNGTNGIDGRSAYQIAIDNGYVGTESEWLLSLHGSGSQDSTPYTLPTASANTLGGVKIGERLNIANGVLSAMPAQVTSGTEITLADNAEYRLNDVTTLNLSYPVGNFECWLKLNFASSGTISVTLPTSTYIGSAPTFANGETWEISIKDRVVIAQKIGDGT